MEFLGMFSIYIFISKEIMCFIQNFYCKLQLHLKFIYFLFLSKQGSPYKNIVFSSLLDKLQQSTYCYSNTLLMFFLIKPALFKQIAALFRAKNNLIPRAYCLFICALETTCCLESANQKTTCPRERGLGKMCQSQSCSHFSNTASIGQFYFFV